MTTIVYPGMKRARDPEVSAQVIRRFMTPQQGLRRVPWQGLFLEPVYADGEPYDRDGQDDGGE